MTTSDAQWHAWTTLVFSSQAREFTRMLTNMKKMILNKTLMRLKLEELIRNLHIFTSSHWTNGRLRRTGTSKWMRESPSNVSLQELDGALVLLIQTSWEFSVKKEFKSKSWVKAQWLSPWLVTRTSLSSFIMLVFQFTTISNSNSKLSTVVAFNWRQVILFTKFCMKENAQFQRDPRWLGWALVKKACWSQWMIMVSYQDSTQRSSSGLQSVILRTSIQRLSTPCGSLGSWKTRCLLFRFHQTVTSHQCLWNLFTRKKSFKFLFSKSNLRISNSKKN